MPLRCYGFGEMFLITYKGAVYLTKINYTHQFLKVTSLLSEERDKARLLCQSSVV